MNYELKQLVEWLKANKLSLNASKTELIIFHQPNKQYNNISIKINNFKLQPVKFVNYLGVSIDETLSWNKQIEILSTKLARANGILSKLRHYAPLHVCVSVYYSIFYSHILYGCIVWSFTSKSNLDSIFKLQKKMIRIITFSDYFAHTNPLFVQLNLLKTDDIFKAELLKFMYDLSSERLPAVFNDFFNKNKNLHSYETRGRSNDHFHIPSVQSSKFGSTLR